MTQITGAMSAVAGYVGIRSATTGAFTDVSGSGNAVTINPQNRASGETYTFDGDTAIITYGKREPIDVVVRIVYTEGAPYSTLKTAHETAGGGNMQVQWIPKGIGAVGNYTYTTGLAKITSFGYPSGDAGSADPLMVEFTVRTESITQATYTT